MITGHVIYIKCVFVLVSAGLRWIRLEINCLAVSCEVCTFRVSNIIAEMHATLGYFQTTEASLLLCFCNRSVSITEAQGHRKNRCLLQNDLPYIWTVCFIPGCQACSHTVINYRVQMSVRLLCVFAVNIFPEWAVLLSSSLRQSSIVFSVRRWNHFICACVSNPVFPLLLFSVSCSCLFT